MPHSPEIAELLRRFVDDRDALQEHEYAQLAEAVKASPELAWQLRDQLTIDDALSQCLAIDRRQFDAQVQQRIADHLRGEDELNQQADELRLLALAGAPRETATSWSTVVTWSSALLLLLAVGIGLWQWRVSQYNALVASVAEIEGQVLVHRVPQGNDEFVKAGLQLRLGDRLSVADDASITLTWSDGTRVQLGGGTQIDLPQTTAGKRVSIGLGNLAASVARQPEAQPMIFVTPHAEAIVRGTELYLRVQANDTRLEVVEGKVELVEHETQDTQLVESSQSATAIPGVKVAKDSIPWPTSRQRLVYLFTAGQRPPLLNKSAWRRSQLEPRENAEFNAQGELQLSGGWFEDNAAADVAAQSQATDALSVEIVFASAQPADDQSRAIVTFAAKDEAAWSLLQAGNRLQFQIAGSPPVEIGSLPEFDKLTHLAVTCRQGELTAFIDGQLTRTVTFAGQLPADASRLILGGLDPAVRWQGRITGLAVYDRALGEVEITHNLTGLKAE